MKMLNYLKAGIMALVILVASINISSIKACHNCAIVEKVLIKSQILFCGWMALAGGAFLGKKVLNNWAEECSKDDLLEAEKKEQYEKYARYLHKVGLFATIPFVSIMLGGLSEPIFWSLSMKCSDSSRLKEALRLVPQILASPGYAMTFLPAYWHTKA